MSTIYCYMHVYMYNSIVNRMILCFNKHNSVFLHEPRRSFSISVPLYDMQVSSGNGKCRRQRLVFQSNILCLERLFSSLVSMFCWSANPPPLFSFFLLLILRFSIFYVENVAALH